MANTTAQAAKNGSKTASSTIQTNEFRLVWLDMEMTGLDPEKERIIEVAVVITEPDLTVVAEGPVLVIHQDDAILNAMDKWNISTHGKSGLIDKVKASTMTESEAEDVLIAFMSQYVPAGKSPLCGNTVSQDRRFMFNYMPRLEQFFITVRSMSVRSRSLRADGIQLCSKVLKSTANIRRSLIFMSPSRNSSTTGKLSSRFERQTLHRLND